MAKKYQDPFPKIPRIDPWGGLDSMMRVLGSMEAREDDREDRELKTLMSFVNEKRKREDARVKNAVKVFQDQWELAGPADRLLLRARANDFTRRYPRAAGQLSRQEFGILDPRREKADNYMKYNRQIIAKWENKPEELTAESDPARYGKLYFEASDVMNNYLAMLSGLPLSEAKRETSVLAGKPEISADGKQTTNYLNRIQNEDGSESFIMRSTADHKNIELSKRFGVDAGEIAQRNGIMKFEEEVVFSGRAMKATTWIDGYKQQNWKHKTGDGYPLRITYDPLKEDLTKQQKLIFDYQLAFLTGRKSEGKDDYGANIAESIKALLKKGYTNRKAEQILLNNKIPDFVLIKEDEGEVRRSLLHPSSYLSGAYIPGKKEVPRAVPGSWQRMFTKDEQGVDVIWDMNTDRVLDKHGGPLEFEVTTDKPVHLQGGGTTTQTFKTFEEAQDLLSKLTYAQIKGGKVDAKTLRDAAPKTKPEPTTMPEQLLARFVTAKDSGTKQFFMRQLMDFGIGAEILHNLGKHIDPMNMVRSLPMIGDYMEKYMDWYYNVKTGAVKKAFGRFDKERFKAAVRLIEEGNE